MSSTTCQFCNEIQGTTWTPFHDIYASIFPGRIVADHQHPVAFPTLGQLVPGSFLVAPKQHAQTFAHLSSEFRIESLHLIKQLGERLQRYGHLFLFKHAAQAAFGGGCGMYHTHLRLIPRNRTRLWHHLTFTQYPS